MKFSASNAAFNSPSPDPFGSSMPEYASVKEGYYFKKWLLYQY